MSLVRLLRKRTMRRSLINLYLQKVSSGDESYLDRLCQQLADRLVYIPVVDDTAAASSAPEVQIQALRIQEEHRSIVPVFTTAEQFDLWRKEEQRAEEPMALFGADLCAALDGKAWIRIYGASEKPVELQPALVKRIASIAPSEFVDETPDTKSEEHAPSRSVPVVNAVPTANTTREMVAIDAPGVPVMTPVIPVSSAPGQSIPAQSYATTSPEPERRKKKFLDFLKTGRA